MRTVNEAPVLAPPEPDPTFAARRALYDALAQAAAKYATATGTAPHLAASIASSMLYQRAAALHGAQEAEAAGCAITTCA